MSQGPSNKELLKFLLSGSPSTEQIKKIAAERLKIDVNQYTPQRLHMMCIECLTNENWVDF